MRGRPVSAQLSALFRAQVPVAAAGAGIAASLDPPQSSTRSWTEPPKHLFSRAIENRFPSARQHALRRLVVRGDSVTSYGDPTFPLSSGQLDPDCTTSDDNNTLCGNQRDMRSFNLSSTLLRA